MAINKVVFDGETLVDLTADTVTPGDLMEGVLAHGADGEQIIGTFNANDIIKVTDAPTSDSTKLYVTEGQFEEIEVLDSSDIPEKLPNPSSITFVGAVQGTYDGSQPVTIDIPQGGGVDPADIIRVTDAEPEDINTRLYITESTDDVELLTPADLPEKLPNPSAITFTGASRGTYDGSQPVTINIPEGGSEGVDPADIIQVRSTEPTDVNTRLYVEEKRTQIVVPTMEDIPQKLPNPNALTFTGAATGSYDGSAPLSIEIPQGGGGSEEVWETIFDGTIGDGVDGDVLTQHILLKGGKRYKKIIAAAVGKQTANAMLCLNYNVVFPDTYSGIVGQISQAVKVSANNFSYAEIVPNASDEFLEVRSRTSTMGTTGNVTNEKVEPIYSDGITGNAAAKAWYTLYQSGVDTISLYSTNTSTALAKARFVIKGVVK